jgi:hypothetical protein
MEDREFGAEFSAGLSDSIAIVVVKRTAILFWSNSAHVYGPRPVRICIKMGGFFFFLRHLQAQLMGDRDYGAEFSTRFPDSIAIVIVIRTAILF